MCVDEKRREGKRDEEMKDGTLSVSEDIDAWVEVTQAQATAY